ncbi:AAA family ATPase [Thermodesulfobacteriota bacterium]
MIKKRGSGDFHKVYRPWAISEIYGQQEAVKFACNGLKKGTLPHALLFSGTSGCGKTTMARAIGMGLNCEKGLTDNPCFNCRACRGILNGAHLAYREINAADYTGVDNMRELRGNFACGPMEGKHQIFVFDECHRLSDNAQEMLLKEVEDTLEHNYFIFCSTDPGKIKDTLKNRLIEVKFGPFSNDEQKRLLQDVCKSERIKNGREVLDTIIKDAGGMPRNALNLLQKAVDQEKLVRAVAGDIVHIAPEKPSNVLVIAPHAVQHDDDNTGIIGKRIAEILDAHAVINEKYGKPETLGFDEPDIVMGLVNLNRWDQIEKFPEVTAEFLKPIEKSKERIKNKYKKTIQIHIHGMSDENLGRVIDLHEKNTGTRRNLNILIGYGQSEAADKSVYRKKFTAKSNLISNVIEKLRKNGIETTLAPITPINGTDGKPKLYCGNDPNGLNQMLCKPKSRTESIQLEIGYTGLRDTEENARNTADRIAKALAGFAEGVDTEKIGSLCINTGISESPEPVVAEGGRAEADQVEAESDADMELVAHAYTKLSNIYSGYHEKAMLEAGQYIVDTFYGNDIERARNNNSPLKKSLFSLLERLNREKAPGLPSKSWVYNSVKFIVAEYDFRDFHLYGKLGLSQKVLLFPISDMKLKKQLITESAEENYTVARLKERIAEETGSNISAHEDPVKLIKDPANLFNSDYSFWQTDRLAALPAEKKKVLITRSRDRIREIASTIAAGYENIDKYEALALTLKYVDNPEAEADVSGTGEWAEENVNISTGCSNMCRYCYACAYALRWKQVASRDEWAIPRIRENDVLKKHPRYPGTVMFPSSHDILPENIYACLITLENLLRAGNKVLIVSKPRIEMIKTLCKHLKRYKSNILFRFTIGAMDNEILSFWEPGAPQFDERRQTLQYAFNKKFATSVSCEPMLDTENIDALIDDLLPLVTDAIWVGKMNRIRHCVDISDKAVEEAVQKIDAGQTDEIIKAIYARHKDNPKIKWKDSIKKVVGLKRAERPGMDQ